MILALAALQHRLLEELGEARHLQGFGLRALGEYAGAAAPVLLAADLNRAALEQSHEFKHMTRCLDRYSCRMRCHQSFPASQEFRQTANGSWPK